MAVKTYATANRSFGSIRKGDVVEIAEDDARGQAYLASGYLTETEESKGAKVVKPGDLEDQQPWDVTVWDGGVTPGAGFDRESIAAKAGQPTTGDAPAGGLKTNPIAASQDEAAPRAEKAVEPRKSTRATESK